MPKFDRKDIRLALDWNRRRGGNFPQGVKALIIILHAWRAFVASNEVA